jgi:FtsP/CotA-like multicopper oxidase with cupredoxin domain
MLRPDDRGSGSITRRRFIGLAAAAGAAIAIPRRSSGASGAGRTAAAGRVREYRLSPRLADVDLGPLGRRSLWTYDGHYPGPEIRAREGERVRVVVENRLPEPTSVHWHGLPVPNAMDGVPGLTQPPIAPGGSFVYEFDATPAGSYMYHSHQGLQIDRGLFGPLVVEERSPHVAYDREYTVVLDDLLPGDPPDMARQDRNDSAGRGLGRRGGMMGRGMMGRGMMGGGMMGMGGMGMMGSQGIPDYLALTMNGRPPADPPTFETTKGERIRLRFVNPSGATTYRVWIAGHRMNVTHADGRPVRPVEVDALDIAMGERYDAIVEAGSPGTWEITAAPLQGSPDPARGILRYADARRAQPAREESPGERVLALGDLEALEPYAPAGEVSRSFEFVL